MRYIASISYGKDSLAMLEIINQHNLPLTDIITVDIMAKTTPPLSAQLPELTDFKKRIDKEIKERYGLEVQHLQANKSFEDLFYRKLTEKSKYKDIYGWPPAFGHWCMNELKKKPIDKYFKGVDCIQYIGIAIDEPARLGRLNDKLRSPLAEYNITEAMAMDICKELDWVAPTYITSNRDGCWFCPCQSLNQLRRLYNDFPDYWKIMKKWDADTGRRFKIDHTLDEYDKRFKLENEGLIPRDNTFRWKMLDEY